MKKILFPCVLYGTQLGISDEYNSRLRDFILKNTPESPTPFKVDTTFWKTNLMDDPLLSEFRIKIEEEAEKYSGRRMVVDEMWASVTRYGCFHNTHTHGPVPLAGVYYVSVPRHPDGLFLSFTTDKWVMGGNSWDEPLENKKLLLFEGWVLHGYAPNPSHEPKITIAFNFQYCSEPRPEGHPRESGVVPRPVLELE